jgi:hypothetical protein
VLGKLIDGRLTFAPEPATRRYRISGTASLGNVLDAIVERGWVPLGWRARTGSTHFAPLQMLGLVRKRAA